MHHLDGGVKRGHLKRSVVLAIENDCLWPNLAAKPTLRTALCGFTVDPLQPVAAVALAHCTTQDRELAQMYMQLALGVCLSCLLVACSTQKAASPEQDPNVAVLRATLSSLDLANPAADMRAHVGSGDLRPVGLNGYTCTVPGADLHPPSSATGIRCLRGTSDAISSAEYARLMKAARNYAVAYDRALSKELRTR